MTNRPQTKLDITHVKAILENKRFSHNMVLPVELTNGNNCTSLNQELPIQKGTVKPESISIPLDKNQEMLKYGEPLKVHFHTN